MRELALDGGCGVVGEPAVGNHAGEHADVVDDGGDGGFSGECQFNVNGFTVDQQGAAVVVLQDALALPGGEVGSQE